MDVERYHVLVVEDNLINRTVAVSLLESYGFEVTEASSGEEAIRLVQENRYDIIFMDHMMPGMDGLEATARIRKECRENGDAPVIIALTSSNIGEMRARFLESGFQDFLEKPLNKDRLKQVLNRWLPDVSLRDVAEEEGDFCFSDIHIPGIHLEEARKNHSGSVETYIDLLRIYYLDSKRKLLYLQELLECQDYKNYGIEVHALKSASASIGAMEVSVRAKEQEKAVDEGNFDFVREHAPDLLRNYRKLRDSVKQFLDGRSTVREGQLEEIDREEMLCQLESALGSLEKFRSRDCARQIERLLSYKLKATEQTRLEDILEELGIYEDDNAETLLREMIQDMKKEET